ncbi:MAG: hypothetical protein IKI57_04415 [Clostridia bacterium]|nr:hypothetical protein [Clostridia bacterium]
MARIINFILLAIAKGIHALINYAVGEEVTLHTIIFGYSKKFTIDFWSISSGDGSIAGAMKGVISYWYVSFRSIAIICYLILLLYLGIKMLLSNNATRLEDIKERLNVWLSGVIILLFFPIVMRYIYVINEVAVKAVEQRGLTGTYDPDHDDLMDNIRIYCTNEDQSNIPLTICYMVMLGELILLIINYYKRAFMVGFLITFFPIVCIKHLFDGINVNGKGHALGAWLKEYCALVFVQLIHAVTYSVLIEGTSQVFAFSGDGDGNVILYLLFVSFLFKAEGIAKSIFQLDSNNGLLFNMANGGAAAIAFGRQAVSGVKDMTHKKESGHDKEDKKLEKEFTNKRREIESSRSASSIRESGQKIDKANSSVEETTKENDKDTSNLKQSSGSSSLTPESVQASGEDNKNTFMSDDEYIAQNLEKAKTVIGEKAMKTRNGSYDNHRRPGVKNAMKNVAKNAGKFGVKTIKGVAGFGVKAAAMGVGLAAGAATGSLTKGLGYGVALSKTAGLATSAAGRVGSWAGRNYKSETLREKIATNDKNMMQDLKDAGVDTDALFNSKKGDMIKKALAEYASGMVRGGKTLADKNYTYEIVKDSLSKTEETKDK